MGRNARVVQSDDDEEFDSGEDSHSEEGMTTNSSLAPKVL